LIVAGVASAYAMTVDRWLGVAIAFVVTHFFFFCNVLRMSRRLELIWAGAFCAMAVATVSLNLLPWGIVLVVSSVVTVIVTYIEVRGPSYHGVGWQKLNPRLRESWQSAGVGRES